MAAIRHYWVYSFHLKNKAITLHRIYLTKDGLKAPVESAKKTMPIPYGQTLSGAAIRLGPAGSSLGMAEGVETALAVMTATGQVCWATTTAVLLQQVVLPPQVQRITIWADNDESNTGLKSAFDVSGTPGQGRPEGGDKNSQASARSQNLGLGGCASGNAFNFSRCIIRNI